MIFLKVHFKKDNSKLDLTLQARSSLKDKIRKKGFKNFFGSHLGDYRVVRDSKWHFKAHVWQTLLSMRSKTEN